LLPAGEIGDVMPRRGLRQWPKSKKEGAATDRALAARVWRISEQQTGVDPARSAVAAVSAAGVPGA